MVSNLPNYFIKLLYTIGIKYILLELEAYYFYTQGT